MFSDGVVDLIESGVINCKKKTLLADKAVTSFCIGTRRLYDYVDNNPFFEFRPTEFTNDPFNVARNAKMVAINAAIEVDLTGQVCADSIGGMFYSGIGGQVDFIRGAARSEGGKPIIVLRSTAKNDTISRIAPVLSEGAGVVTTRGDVHFVVTEYGVAELWGKNVRERALALIAIAHPKFRAELLEEAKQRNLLYQDQMMPTPSVYPAQWETETTLRDGTHLSLRPIRPTDEPLMKDLFYACSEATIYHRFFMHVKTMPHSKLQRFVNVDYANEMAIVGLVNEEGQNRIICVGRYALDHAANMAEVAFLVRDDFQGKGIGTFLLHHLMNVAQSQGIAGFTAEILADNRAMIHVLHKSGCEMKTSLAEGIYHLEFRFNEV
jgi:RimJ/RimL family protein N-acetyltransferase